MANTMVSLIISIVVLLCITSAQGRETHYELPTSSQVNNDGICKTMVEIQGYTCEEHQVTTKDGYILSLQRMPTTRSGKKADKPPVLLQHGLFTDAITWLVNNPDESLPFILADSGFDVWLVNSRGTNYSQTHKSLSPNDKAYWEWSWDELASYDLPASVEYVYKITGQKMHYAGHSQGTLMALAALSQGEVVNMLRSAALLSPIAHLNQIPSELTKLGADLFLADDVYWLGLYKFDPDLETESKFLLKLCQTLHLLDCSKLITEITGPNCCINSSRIDVYLNHKSQPTSTKNLIHLSQMIRTGKIAKYDYKGQNMQHYGQAVPPSYDMTKIPNEFPLFFGYGGQDMLSDVNDVQVLFNDLKDHDGNKLVKVFKEEYAHSDFTRAANANKFVYDPMVAFFNNN